MEWTQLLMELLTGIKGDTGYNVNDNGGVNFKCIPLLYF